MGVSGLLLLFPFLLLRFGLLGRLGRDGLGRAAHIPPMGGRERLAYWVYQLSSAGVLVCLCAQRAEVDGAWPFWAGLVLYLLGLALCAGMCMAALAFFAAGPLVSLFNRDGDPALQQMAEQGLRLYFLGFPFAGLNLITASFLGAAEHPGRSLRLSLLRGFVSIVAAALLLAALLALTGVWLAFPAAEGAVLLVSLRFSRSLRRARPEPAPQAITTALR